MYLALSNGVMGSIYRVVRVDQHITRPEKDSRDRQRAELTEFPMTRIRLLKVWFLGAGKASTERTGHLGIVDLVFSTSARCAKGARARREVHPGPQCADCSARSIQKSAKATMSKHLQVGVRSLVVAIRSSNTFSNATPSDAAPSAPAIDSTG
jgi:hypothetical protein